MGTEPDYSKNLEILQYLEGRDGGCHFTPEENQRWIDRHRAEREERINRLIHLRDETD